ncbi:MAG: glucose-6-phosphate isomerase [Desulfobacteraceae bacterium]|nr:glucose-6-phosphate isomerase [Desulfobacteraceae bacterium]
MLPKGLLHPDMLQHRNVFKKLTQKATDFGTKPYHLKELIQQPDRFSDFSLKTQNFFLDFSRQRIDQEVFEELILLAEETKACQSFSDMTTGKIVNTTEKRAALHTGARNFSDNPLKIGDLDVNSEINRVNREIKAFSSDVHQGKIKGSTGKAFTQAVVIGIGGSYLGCEFAFEALRQTMDPKIMIHFLPNVDIDNFNSVIKKIDPETCLWIVISKSYTTTETMANLAQAQLFLDTHGLSCKDHLVTVTAQKSPGDNPSNPVLAAFHMFDFIGGRFSVTSAVGGVPLSLAFGFDYFERFLKGCHAMDTHALSAPQSQNIPLVAALISIWNTFFLNYSAMAVIPYSSGLSKLPAHVQQLYMESLGKQTSSDGQFLTRPAGTIIFGEPGTNAQHSFFQLAHQGPAFPIEFIGIVNPAYDGESAKSKGVTNHQELWANMIAQSLGLAIGKEDKIPAKYFPGNRPSSLILIHDLTPESIGNLLSFYEARTVFEGFILGINSFDQFGVELGKVMATDIRKEIELKNQTPDHGFDHLEETKKFYLETLFQGSLE